MPEAALAREAELCYQTVAMVTDFDAWHGEHEAVDVAQVLEVLHRNVASAQSLVVAVAERLGGRATDCARDRKSTRLTPVTNAHLVCRLLLEKKKSNTQNMHQTDVSTHHKAYVTEL